ncbi:MAG TPA: HNH endonuclease signature motif containing protein [Cytophagaceae bacterium]
MDNQSNKLCGLCERVVSTTSKHHLIPKQEGGKHTLTVGLCQPCHTNIHLFIPNKVLAKKYYTIELLRSAPELQNYLAWIKNKTLERISNRSRKK